MAVSIVTWIDQPPYADGAVLRVVDMNGVRGNLNDTEAGLAAVEGDTFYATGQNVIARLALGTEDSVYAGWPIGSILAGCGHWHTGNQL